MKAMIGRGRVLLALGFLVPALAIKGDGPSGTEDYYWHKRGGTYMGGAVPFNVPTNLSKEPAWVWDNADDELVRHGPVIDGRKNIYLVTAAAWIRKFAADGVRLWSRRLDETDGKVVVSPFLYKGRLYLASMGPGSTGWFPMMHCLDMETGDTIWTMPMTKRGFMNHDSNTVHVAEDVLLTGLGDKGNPAPGPGGASVISAKNATDGRDLWEVTVDSGVMWNFQPSTGGDGTFFFSTTCGAAERRSLSDGSVIWQGALRKDPTWCGTGGGTLGPNGVFYAEANYIDVKSSMPLPGIQPCIKSFDMAAHGPGCPEGMGILVAYRAEDGKVLWSRSLPRDFGGWQYPAVGKIHGGRLAVVAGIGTNSMLVIDFSSNAERWMPATVLFLLAEAQLRSRLLRWLLGIPAKRNAVATFDADTGKLIWMFEEKAWTYFAAKGDEEPFHQRAARSQKDPRMESICGPDNWGIPAITADGTVIAGSGNTGDLFTIRDENGDGIIQDGEVSTFKTEQAFLNSPALAPGLMAVAPCWGPMYVFTSDGK